MELTGAQGKELREAIISAYPGKEKLKMMVSDELEENLDAIAGGDNLDEIVFSLIEWAQSQGKLEELVNAGIKRNPGNEKLREFQESIFKGFNSRESPQIVGDGLHSNRQNATIVNNNIGQITGEVQFAIASRTIISMKKPRDF